MPPRHPESTVCVVTIEAQTHELYEDWLDPKRAGSHLRQLIGSVDEKALEWLASDSPELEVELTDQKADESVGWTIRTGASARYRGRTFFRSAPGGRGTEVGIELFGVARLSRLRSGVALLVGGHPSLFVGEDLRKYKQQVETGEVITTEGQPAGKRSLVGRTLVEALEETLRRGYSPETRTSSARAVS